MSITRKLSAFVIENEIRYPSDRDIELLSVKNFQGSGFPALELLRDVYFFSIGMEGGKFDVTLSIAVIGEVMPG